MAKRPSRIDLLELDIDLRLADLWGEACGVGEWNLEVVAAFLRAAYGKGYCDALTEDAPGSLCRDHGYRIPDRRPARHPGVGTSPPVNSMPWPSGAIRCASSSRSRRGGAGGLPHLDEPRRRDALPAAESARGQDRRGRARRDRRRLRPRATRGFGLRFTLRDIEGEATVPVVYTGSVPDLFKVGREVYVKGELTGEHLRGDRGLARHEVPVEVRPGQLAPCRSWAEQLWSPPSA